jgi:hypothetical protein
MTKMKKHYIFISIALLFLIVFALSGCSHPETRLGPIPLATWMKTTASISQESYKVGEEVVISLNFQNIGNQTYLLKAFPPKVILSPSEKFGINVREITEGDQSFSLEAGHNREYSIIWDQLDRDGKQVQAGEYKIILGNIEVDNQQLLLKLENNIEINIISPD